jgi:hypothetical protein
MYHYTLKKDRRDGPIRLIGFAGDGWFAATLACVRLDPPHLIDERAGQLAARERNEPVPGGDRSSSLYRE